jgi:anthranilate phosphoribosyltransferase
LHAPANSSPALADRREQQLQALGTEAARFRQLIGKVGSGTHTSTGLSRAEAAEAMALMLGGRLPPAQLGAFLIAHRIRRPAPLELAGMLDALRAEGPALHTPGRRALCFGVPYDGRSRTAPLLPLLALTLAAAGQPVVLHGGGPMPVKYGVTLAELFGALGIDWPALSLEQLQRQLDRHQLALSHQPRHLPAAEPLVQIRDLIGKRPPLATLELLWTPHRGAHLQVCGFVHPPTETLALEALQLAGERDVLLLKGQEGSTDLPLNRAGIATRLSGEQQQRLELQPRDHGLEGSEVAWGGLESWREQAMAGLGGQGPLAGALVWNLGVLLWQSGAGGDLPAAIGQARALLAAGAGEGLRRQLAG